MPIGVYERKRRPVTKCSVDGCASIAAVKGLCTAHYLRMYRHGRTEAIRRPKGEGTIDQYGYRLLTDPDGRQRREHVMVAEKALGRPLPEGAVVHHVDGDKLNNAGSNLVICPDDTYHKMLHVRERALDACGDPNKRKCKFCKEHDSVSNMKLASRSYYHQHCQSAHDKARRAGQT